MRRAIVVAVAVALSCAGAAVIWGPRAKHPSPVAPPPIAKNPPIEPIFEDESNDLHFRVPSGGATHVSCQEARRIVHQVRTELSYEPDAVAEHEFSTSTSDWLDPHSFWSLPEDVPTQKAFDANAKKLIAELEGEGAHCDAATAIGASLAEWSHALRGRFEAGYAAEVEPSHAEEKDLPSDDATLARAEEIGRRAKAFRSAIGDVGDPYVNAARDRFFPEYDEKTWGEVVLASAVRAYVPLVDPHGAWAPLEEKSSVYEVGLFAAPPEKPWGKVSLTAVGFRIDDGSLAPLQDGDVVLQVNEIKTAAMPLEQIEQLGFTATQSASSYVVARKGALVTLRAPSHPERKVVATSDAPAEPHVAVDRIPYGNQEVTVIAFQDVRDDLGEDIRDILAETDHEKTAGIVLDLRGNGGGSTDGAINALGYFIPNALLFPTKRRDGTIEIDRAPAPQGVWDGPVATLVDGATASAGEMIAGALMAYGRGASVGATTFGKGCAQEYLDDEPGVGVLRLTTLIYALPDGTPVQRVGITPQIKLPFIVKTDDQNETEASLKHTAPTWGPDHPRKPLYAKKDSWTWSSHAGKIGPCEDGDVCHALRALGSRRPQIAKNKPDTH